MPQSRRNFAALGLAVLYAVMSWLSFFPANVGWLAWFSLIPLLFLSRWEMSRWKRTAISWLAGAMFFFPALSWMRVADPMMTYSWIALASYCACFVVIVVVLLRWLTVVNGWQYVWATPVTIVAVEYFRATLFGGFTWYFLGHTQHDRLLLIQTADLAGVYAVSFLVAAVNGLIVDVALSGATAMRRATLGLLTLVCATMLYGMFRLNQNEFGEGPVVSLLQGDIPQHIRNEAESDASVLRIMSEYVSLMNRAVEQKPDLIIWPETSYPYEYGFIALGISQMDMQAWLATLERSQSDVHNVGSRWLSTVLIGVNTGEYGPRGRLRRFNTALLVNPRGEPVDRYHKMHRVPFGEFVPFVESMPWLKALTPYQDFDYSVAAGDIATRFTIRSGGRDFRFGVLICYEDSDAPLARDYVSDKAVDFLVNLTNDGWFRETSEQEQHLAVSRFRAIECRRALVRAVNSGVSAFIDPNGRVVNTVGPTWTASKDVAGVVTARVPIDHRSSLYARLGDWFPLLCWLIIIAKIAKQTVRRRLRKAN